MPQLAGSRILVVDDDPHSLDILCDTLDAEGCTVLVATSGEAALAVADRSQPDLVVVDVRLAGIDGLETCRRLKAQRATASVPVVLISADPREATILEGLRAGAVDFLAKRPPWDEVLLRLRNQLNQARLARGDG